MFKKKEIQIGFLNNNILKKALVNEKLLNKNHIEYTNIYKKFVIILNTFI